MQTETTYRNQPAWSRIQSHLPERYRFAEADLPTEETWNWRGHRIHLDRYYRPDAPARVVLFHGVGTNGRQMSTILGHPLAQSGIETVSVDMPGYGVTEVAPGANVTYDDWVQAGTDFVEAELARDPRPIFLYGLSAGGMLTYHVASRSRARVSGIIGMTFLDLRNRDVALGATLTPWLGRISLPFLGLGKLPGLRALKLPMRLVGKMHKLVNDKATMRDMLKDGTSAGNWASLSFLQDFMTPQFDVEPEDFDVCPVLLTQPAEDRWTPLWMATSFLDRIRRVPVQQVMLENASHYPIEEPGLTQMHDAVLGFIRQTLGKADVPVQAVA
ncbi:alpha/beta hydrolase [Novosphingobium sp. ZN18A2]|uniref:alpha/beta hydrolase n=1 Tax=Novosphingobium sp. ZN18A2 TaxID=3079861 RepID=UPI0030D57DFC